MDILELIGDDIDQCTCRPCRWHTQKVNDSFCRKHRKIMEIFEKMTLEERSLVINQSRKRKAK